MEGRRRMLGMSLIGLEVEILTLDQQLAVVLEIRNFSPSRGDLTKSLNLNWLETLVMEPFEKMITRYFP